MSTRKPKPNGINKDMAKYYLQLEKLLRRIERVEFAESNRIMEQILSEYDQNKRDMFYQRMCDYAYGED